MRINRGIYKSRRFSTPKNFPSRPTTDFAKEGLFNLIENRVDLLDLNILDLCAGTGNISMEFLSREAGNVISIDKHPVCVKHMYKMKDELKVGDQWVISKNDIQFYLANTNLTFDIIFADPPYDFKFHKEVVDYALAKNALAKNGMLIIEHGKQTELENVAGFVEKRNFGNVYFSFFHRKTD